MVVFSHTNELKEAQFTHVDLRGARFVETGLIDHPRWSETEGERRLDGRDDIR